MIFFVRIKTNYNSGEHRKWVAAWQSQDPEFRNIGFKGLSHVLSRYLHFHQLGPIAMQWAELVIELPRDVCLCAPSVRFFLASHWAKHQNCHF